MSTGAPYKYWAFISYSHRDRAWGDWLHKTLETYRVPRRLVGRASRDGAIPRRLFPVFRDRDELPSSADLGGVINEALAASRYQIVICSPRSAASRWVNEEVRHFKSLGRADRVLCLIVDGEPNVFDVPGRDIEECFAPAIRFRVERDGTITNVPAEPIAADARPHADGKAGARLKLLSGLLGVSFDELRQREKRRQFWQRVQLGAAALAVAAMLAGAWQWVREQRDRREHQIAVERMVESGRLELLAGHEARAAVLLNQAYQEGERSVPLRFMLARAMAPVDALTKIRVKQAGYSLYGAVAFDAEGSRFLLGERVDREGRQESLYRVHDAATGAVLHELRGGPLLPLTALFLGDGSRVLVSGFPVEYREGDPFTAIWDLRAGGPPRVLPGVNGLLGKPADPTGTRVLVAGASGLAIHDAAGGQPITRFAEGQAIDAASFSPDGQSIALAEAGGAARIVAAADGKIVQALEGAGPGQAAIVFTPDGTRVLALSAAGDVRVWDVRSGALRLAFAADPLGVNTLRFDRDGRRFLTVGTEGYKVWSMRRGGILFARAASLDNYATAALSDDGDTMVTAEPATSVAEVWDVRSGSKLYSLDLHASGITGAAFDPQARRLLLASRDGAAEIWRMPVEPFWRYDSFETYPYSVAFDGVGLLAGAGNYEKGNVLRLDPAGSSTPSTLGSHDGVVYDAAIDPGRTRIATASRDGSAALWDAVSGAQVARLPHEAGELWAVRFSRDGSRLLTRGSPQEADRPDRAGLWDGRDGRHVAWLAHAGLLRGAEFDPAGRLAATAGQDREIRIWDAADGRLVRTLSGHAAAVASVQFSGNGKLVLSAAEDDDVRIWDVASGAVLHRLARSGLGVPTLAAFAPGEGRVAVATEVGSIALWDPASGNLATLKGHAQQVRALAWSADGLLLFSSGADGSTRAWDPAGARELGVLSVHADPVNSLDLDETGRRLASASWSQLRIADVALEQRSPEVLAAVLACASPWVYNPGTATLDARQPDPGRCK